MMLMMIMVMMKGLIKIFCGNLCEANSLEFVNFLPNIGMSGLEFCIQNMVSRKSGFGIQNSCILFLRASEERLFGSALAR